MANRDHIHETGYKQQHRMNEINSQPLGRWK